MPRQNRSSQICLQECVCYHVISRCTRQLHLLGGDEATRHDRKAMLLEQLEASGQRLRRSGWRASQ